MIPTTTETIRISKGRLFRSLGYEPHPGQVLVHRSRAPRRVLACGSRWGKTMCAAHEAAAAMLEPRERSLGWVVAPTYDLADRVFRMLVQIVETHLKHRIREISPREKRIVLTNLGGGTSEARGKSADRPDSLLGEGLNWLIVDEAAQLERDIWDEHLSQRLIDHSGWALLISTPKGAGWFLRMYRRGQQGKDAAYESWSSPTTANPHMNAAAIEAERLRLPEETYRQEYLAEFIRALHEPCDLCGGPRKGAVGLLIKQDDSEPSRCQECDQPVDENGQTVVALWPDGSAHFQIIREIGQAWVSGAPDQLISPATLAADEQARIGPSRKVKWVLTPEELALLKASLPAARPPAAAPERKIDPSRAPPIRGFPLGGGWLDDA